MNVGHHLPKGKDFQLILQKLHTSGIFQCAMAPKIHKFCLAIIN